MTSPSDSSKKTLNLSHMPKIPCPKHPTLTIHSLCFQQACKTPYICSQCEVDHPKDHVELFQTVDSIYSDRLLANYKKTLESDFRPKT